MSKTTTVTVTLRRSYLYTDPETGRETMYHPGETEIPQGLADALLLSSATEDEKPVAAPDAAASEPEAGAAAPSTPAPRRAPAKKAGRKAE